MGSGTVPTDTRFVATEETVSKMKPQGLPAGRSYTRRYRGSWGLPTGLRSHDYPNFLALALRQVVTLGGSAPGLNYAQGPHPASCKSFSLLTIPSQLAMLRIPAVGTGIGARE